MPVLNNSRQTCGYRPLKGWRLTAIPHPIRHQLRQAPISYVVQKKQKTVNVPLQ